MTEKSVDSIVQHKLIDVGFSVKEINYGYRLLASGNKDFNPIPGQRYLSKNKKETSVEYEFLIFRDSKKEHLIIIEDKNNEKNLGNQTEMLCEGNLGKKSMTDVFFYAVDLLEKTEKVKTIFAIAVAGRRLKSSAIYLYKKSEVIDRYSKFNVHAYNDKINYIVLESWKDWEQLPSKHFSKYINEKILNLSAPDNEENLAHIKTVAASLSKTIDTKLKLDPFKRLLLVSGLLLAINEDSNVVQSFDKAYGAKDLYNRISEALPDNKFSIDKKNQLLYSFNFIKNDPKITREIINVKKEVGKQNEGYPLELISKELTKKSATGYSIVDLMKQSSHIDLLGHLFDIFTKYMNVGGSSGDITLTPSHLTKFMTEIIDVNPDDYVADITAGTGGFLISAMHTMEQQVIASDNYSSAEKDKIIKDIRANHLWGVENDDNMYATCVTNMLLHDDGKSHIFRGDSLSKIDLTSNKTFDEIFKDVKLTKLLFNPPYTDQELFVKNGLDILEKNGLAAILIPKQTFSIGDASIVSSIFKMHSMLAFFDLPKGQFKTQNGTRGTDVGIFIFKAHRPQQFGKDYITLIKVKKDYVGTKGSLKGVATEQTVRVYSQLVSYVKSNYMDDEILIKSADFDRPLKKKIEKGKYIYTDYSSIDYEIPNESDFIDTIGKYLEYMLGKKNSKGGE